MWNTAMCMCNVKLIQILFSSLSVSIVAGLLNVNTFGDGTATLVCSADGGVVNMQWNVSYSGMSRAIDLYLPLPQRISPSQKASLYLALDVWTLFNQQ